MWYKLLMIGCCTCVVQAVLDSVPDFSGEVDSCSVTEFHELLPAGVRISCLDGGNPLV